MDDPSSQECLTGVLNYGGTQRGPTFNTKRPNIVVFNSHNS